jgi:hypothetical protein
MSKQTAVEWLVEQVNADCLNSTFIRKELIDEAKAMEKEQIADAYYDGKQDIPSMSANEYYKQTYKTEKNE